MEKGKLTDEIKKAIYILERCVSELDVNEPTTRTSKHSSESKRSIKKPAGEIDFSVNERAFANKHSNFLTSGQEIFTLIVAYIAKGETDRKVHLAEIKGLWKRVEGIFSSKYASIYSTRAKENDWVDTPEKGIYVLRPNWYQIFNSQ